MSENDDGVLVSAPIQVWKMVATVTEKPAKGEPRKLVEIERSDRGALRIRTWARGKATEWLDTNTTWWPLTVKARCSAARGEIGCQVASGRTVPGVGVVGAVRMIGNELRRQGGV